VGDISLVLFDLDGVLCNYDRAAHIAHIAHLVGKDPAEVYDAIWASGFDADADAGTVSAAEYLRGFGPRIGRALTPDQWLEGRRAATTAACDVLDVVAEVRRAARVAVLSNNTTLVTEHIDAFLPALRPLFGGAIHVSAEFGAVKPSSAVYLRCVATLAASPARTLFVDDLEENVVGARAAGLRAWRHTSAMSLEAVMQDYCLL
jgi:putative hydrolase of the HAD superfamily